MLILLALLAPVLPASLPAVDTPAVVQDDDGWRETRYVSGELEERYEVDDQGRKHGSYERYHTSGQVEIRCKYAKDVREGPFESFNRHGDPIEAGRYKRGKKSGAWRVWEAGALLSKTSYRAGVAHGPAEEYDGDGRPVRWVKYRSGELHGKFREARPDEKWERSGSYDEGILDGRVQIKVRGKVVSKREWDKGHLVEIDGMVAYPETTDALFARLEGARVVPDPDPEDEKSVDRLSELARLKEYRALCGVPHEGMALRSEWNALCDAAGRLLEAHGGLSHTPPQPDGYDDDEYARGYQGTSSSNLFSGGLRGGVDAYMDDSDATNVDRVGHRRWCLTPRMLRTAFGGHGRWSAMWAFDSSRTKGVNMDHVMYPPRGYVPVDMFGGHYAWSISLHGGKSFPSAGKLEITVTPLDELHEPFGEPCKIVDLTVSTSGIGDSQALIFRPEGLRARDGLRYRATIREKGAKQPLFDWLVQFVARPKATAEGDRRD